MPTRSRWRSFCHNSQRGRSVSLRGGSYGCCEACRVVAPDSITVRMAAASVASLAIQRQQAKRAAMGGAEDEGRSVVFSAAAGAGAAIDSGLKVTRAAKSAGNLNRMLPLLLWRKEKPI